VSLSIELAMVTSSTSSMFCLVRGYERIKTYILLEV